jgi:TolB-like protein/Tfp pilus assembly protein PilF/predicted Ser/Thr protein kinase
VPLTEGDKLGPYEILAPIGAGGMGEVWKARDTRLGRIVAIKRLKGPHGDRFEQEARAIAALNHPHICTLYDIGPDYLVMEYIEGSPLKGPLPADEAVRLAVQIASALEAAHAKGILHRDLKPGNVLVTAAGAKLLDFGLAKLTADADATQTVGTSGTPLYMSPEQAEGKVLDVRTDVFSFGAVLYELLSGRRAFDSLGAVLRDEPAPLQSPIADIVRRCLSKQASGRFHSMSEVKAALDQIATKSATGQQPSIAVLPFANMSADKENEYFSDGLAEEILNLLAKIPGLKVIARTSSFAFRGKEQDITKIAEALRVQNILEGSVRRAGNRIRVTAQLIHAADGSHVWSERYDRELADVFAVQDEISAAIAQALQVKLSPQAAAKPRYTPKLPAYEALLKAKHFHWKVTPEAMAQAREFYEQAIALDPQYALAHAVYAEYTFGRAVFGMTPAHETMPAARALAQRALELDSSLPDAHAILCAVATEHDYDWKEAARRFTLATAADALSPWALAYLAGFYLLALGRKKEALDQVERAFQGDPLHPGIRSAMAGRLAAVGRYAEAEAHLRQILDLDPNSVLAYLRLADIYAARRMFSEALPFAEKVLSLAPWYAPNAGFYAGLLVRMGEPNRGKELIQWLGSGQAYGAPFGLAVFHTFCGEIDLAADWFEKAIEERYPGLALWLQSASGEPLRSSQRWPKLAALMNLPEKAS